jgi:hypothetical protein
MSPRQQWPEIHQDFHNKCRNDFEKFLAKITIKFQPLSTAIYYNLAKFRLPQEAYKFLGALDGLIGQLPLEAPANPGWQKIIKL